MIPIREWLKSNEVQKLKKMSLKELLEIQFSREPMVPLFYNENVIYSPANGIILYVKELTSIDEIIVIKGKSMKLNELMGEEIKGEHFLIIGIFMTAYDVHVNRMPTSGFLTYKRLDSLKIENLSMIKVEESILNGNYFNFDDMDYLFYNERILNKIFSPIINQEYYIVQIADAEVNMIVPFFQSGTYLIQSDAFAQVRFGSQVDLIIPMKKDKNYECLIKDKILFHVEAGIDPLVKVQPKPLNSSLT